MSVASRPMSPPPRPTSKRRKPNSKARSAISACRADSSHTLPAISKFSSTRAIELLRIHPSEGCQATTGGDRQPATEEVRRQEGQIHHERDGRRQDDRKERSQHLRADPVLLRPRASAV